MVMHIGREGWLRPVVHTQCGLKLKAEDLAPKGAPLCSTCMRRAGWTYDKRGGGGKKR